MSFETPTSVNEAHERFHTLQITASLSADTAALSRLMVRYAAAHAPEGQRSVRLVDSRGGKGGDRNGNGWQRQTWRIWWMPPTLWREEMSWPGGQTVVYVVRPDVSESYISMHETLYTSEPAPPRGRLAELGSLLFDRARDGAWPAEAVHSATIAERLAEFPLLNPKLPASQWELTTLGEESYIHRTVRRVRATRRRGIVSVNESERSGYWPWLNEYEYLVDDALEILLHLTGLEDGKPVGMISADDVIVDRPFSEEVFTFAAPAGTHVAHVQQRT
jgi:hypothetical protein